jgi:hypothetical protein
MSINLVPEYMLPKSSFIEEGLSSTGSNIASEPAWTARAEPSDSSLAVFEEVARSSGHHHDSAPGDRTQALCAS